MFICLHEECRKLIDELNKKEFASLNDYDLIIIHRSSLSNGGINTVISHCKSKRKPLVFFSGGVGQSLFYFEPYPYFLLNSKDFYNNTLPEFLRRYVEDKIEHISELIYGDNWKLNIMMTYRQTFVTG
ncbi:hypothetical protein [Tenuifilum thalassicum]|uniref:Uncharacterized protein n=1 Tax=Tenuifilum thalassicum TaxID=2590900 RepID=A0A7D3XU32_9BACT|nr:hypothetical protein [Tenuifilum thalassicum]QKG79311.1 hypothetical protein FHG85_03210 [Tenuifilum thalassicum]